MKRFKYLLILLCSCLFLVACDNSLTRVDRAVGLIQEDTTAILNDLTEIQTQEKNLQAAFETDLGQNDLALFNKNDSQVDKNIQERKSRIDDINKKRGNANKLLVRFLLEQLVKADLRLCDIQAGGLHNAIPREAHAIVVVPTDRITPLCNELQEYGMRVKEEFSSTEPDATFIATEVTVPADCLTKSQTERILKSLIVVHNGIFAMSQDIDDLVETSSNLANIKREGSEIIVNTSQRSSVASNLTYMAEVIRAAFELGGAQCVTNEGYPGWKVNPKSEIVKVAVESYKRLFKKEPKVRAIHAGLECGLFSEKYPNLDMVSFGPTLRGVHSPDERLLIPTVQMVWDHLLYILKNIPNQ